MQPGCLVVYDVNLRQHFYQRDWLETSLRASQIVKLNAEEVIELDKLLDLGTGHVGNVPHGGQVDFAKAVQQRFGVHTVCITRGGRGCLLVGPDDVADDPGKPVRVADTVGAGDAFTAGLIAARLRGWSLEAQATFGNAVGALVASRSGAMPVFRDEELGRLLLGFDAR